MQVQAMESSAHQVARHCQVVGDMYNPIHEKHCMQEEELLSLRAELYSFQQQANNHHHHAGSSNISSSSSSSRTRPSCDTNNEELVRKGQNGTQTRSDRPLYCSSHTRSTHRTTTYSYHAYILYLHIFTHTEQADLKRKVAIVKWKRSEAERVLETLEREHSALTEGLHQHQHQPLPPSHPYTYQPRHHHHQQQQHEQYDSFY